jgi:hypothetical protein
MTDTLTNILQWLIPSGGLGAVIAWIASRRVRNTKIVKEVHDTYKTMYEDVQHTLLENRNENEKLYKAVNKLERAVSRATMCRYWDSCPIRAELPDGKGITHRKNGKNPSGQPRIRNPADKNSSCAGGEGEPDGSDTEPA